MKRYEILESLPVYGSMYVPVTEKGEPYYSEGLPIRFFKSNGEEWVANFKPGWTKFNWIHEFEDQNKLLVIAGGTCYLMNPDEILPLSVFGVDYEKVLEMLDGRLILQGGVDLTIVEPNTDYWDTQRISWDGFKDLNLVGNNVTGFSYDPTNHLNEWSEFNYDVDSKILIGGSYNNFRILNDNPVKKLWWKIMRIKK